MRASILSLLFLVLGTTLFAQARKTTGQSGMPVVVPFNDPARVDFFPSLIHLDQHPVPSAEYGDKKEILNRLRAQKEAEGFGNVQSKPSGLAVNPIVVKGIQGNTANSVPNDNDIAVSNAGKVVSVVNSNMRVYDDTGAVLGNSSLSSLTSSVGTFSWISDPRVLYDPVADRFVLVCFSGSLSTTSTIIVGFTQTNDPMGSWNFYTINGNPFNDSTWSDYPIIALSDKDLFMTFNQVRDNVSWTVGFKQSVIWQIDKQTGYTGAPLQYTLWDSLQYNGINLRNICPAKYQTTPFGNNMYFLTLRNVASTNDSVFVTEITNSHASGQATLQMRLLSTPVAYGFPPNARQKHPVNGNIQYLMTNDARVLAAVYENDYIHWGSNTVNTQYMNAGVYLGRIKNISSATPVVEGDIFSTQTMEYGYPSMTYVGGGGNDHRILYTFSHCVTDSFPGTSILYRDAAGQYSDIIRVKDGSSYINLLADTNERWGDYTNIQKMYNNPNRAYLSGSWGKSNAMNSWVTVVDIPEWPLAAPAVEKVKQSTLFPNPVQEKRFRVNFELQETQDLSFTLCDLNGRVLYRIMKTRVKAGRNEYSFDTGSLPAGQYLFRISGDKGEVATHRVEVH